MKVIYPQVTSLSIKNSKRIAYKIDNKKTKELYINTVKSLSKLKSKGATISIVTDKSQIETTLSNVFVGTYFGSIVDNIYYTEMEKLDFCKEIDADIYVDETRETFRNTNFDTLCVQHTEDNQESKYKCCVHQLDELDKYI